MDEITEIEKVVIESQNIRDAIGISREHAISILNLIEQRKTNKLLDWIYDTITTN